MESSILKADPHDWDWLIGKWTVRHRKLRKRLVGSTDWVEFPGTCCNWALLGGLGNVDDNVFFAPEGTYGGVGLRALDPASGLWAIWWLDSRVPNQIDAPVRGGFIDGVGIFTCEDRWEGKPVNVRFCWSNITTVSAQWEQAFSVDGGTEWEVNWTMEFQRSP